MVDDLNTAIAGIEDLQQAVAAGNISTRELVEQCIERIEQIDRAGPTLRSILDVNPDAGGIADVLDSERRQGKVRGALHGIPVLIKDNLDTADGMKTTAGSLALQSASPPADATVVRLLRLAGAVPLAKTNLSEWANFRSSHSSSGWSARGGQCLNPYALDRSPSGSSSGSAAAVAAGLAPVSIGTETDGSILSPASACGLVGIKPTVGLTSRKGIIPISQTQDSVGVFARRVRDAALVLGVIVGENPVPGEPNAHPALTFTSALRRDALKGARIGIPREPYFGYSPPASGIAENALRCMAREGAVLVDPVEMPSAEQLEEDECEVTVLLYEFKAGLNAYLRGRGGDPEVGSLAELIAFNAQHVEQEMLYFGQDLFLMAEEKGPLTDAEYLEALRTCHRLAREEGVDAVMERHRLDALVMPTASPAIKIDLVNGGRGYGGSSQMAAVAGYPAISVPAGFVRGLPVGITFVGRARSEAKLLGLAHAFEQAMNVWQPPKFIPHS